jgi:hypothetical protein
MGLSSLCALSLLFFCTNLFSQSSHSFHQGSPISLFPRRIILPSSSLLSCLQHPLPLPPNDSLPKSYSNFSSHGPETYEIYTCLLTMFHMELVTICTPVRICQLFSSFANGSIATSELGTIVSEGTFVARSCFNF